MILPPDDEVPGSAPGTSSFFLTQANRDAAMTYFYGHLFAADPGIGRMFPPMMRAQRHRFAAALRQIAAGAAADPVDGQMADYLASLGRAHRKFGVLPEHYAVFRASLLATCRQFGQPTGKAAGGSTASGASAFGATAFGATASGVTASGDGLSWDAAPEDRTFGDAEFWGAAFDRAARLMIAAAEDDAERAPAWWLAEVTGIDWPAPGVAVLALRPGEPFGYLPGQHVAVQTSRWPRLWREYSVANAPREDGTLTLHVRAVPGGLVSTALAHHSGPGDILVLGAASGTMTADTASGRDVLCLAGGTGLAPLKAIVEAVTAATRAGGCREVVLYHGARTQRDLYDLPALRRMEKDYPWLQVIPVTSEEPAPYAMHGTIAEVCGRACWKDRDIYVSGPGPMITACMRTLRGAGAPPERIHYDLPAELPRLDLEAYSA